MVLFKKLRERHKGENYMDEQLRESVQIIISRKRISITHDELINHLSELISSSLLDYELNLLQPTQQLDRP